MHEPSTIARPHLESRLDGALTRRLTCVVAGAGFGKTTLLTRWAAGTTSAWHGLGAADRTLTGLVRTITDVLRARVPGLPPDLVAATRGSRGPDIGSDEAGRAQAYAGRISEALTAGQARDLVLVLDDVESLPAGTDSVAFVAALCRQAPSTLHVVLSSRAEPPFPLARLRGQGQVLDLSAAELAFSEAETLAVVQATMGEGAAALAPDIHRMTAGWPAAVRLATEALANDAPTRHAATLERLRRPGGMLHDYLADEVVAAEPPEVRELLGRLALLDRFTPELAGALGPPGTAGELAGLIRRGLVVATPGRTGADTWLALNALIRSMLDSRNRDRADPGRRPTAAPGATVARAARWFETHGQAADALRCALDAGIDDEVHRLVMRWGPRLLAEGEAATVLAGLVRLPAEERTPEVDRLEGEAHQLLGDWEAALACFERAAGAAAGVDSLPAGLAWRMGLIHHLRGDLETALAVYGRGLLTGDGGHDDSVDQALLVAWTATAHWLLGDGDACRPLADGALARARRCGDDRALAAAHTVQALVAALDGDRLANDTHYVRALDHAERAGDLLQIIRIRLNRGSRFNEEGFYDDAITELDLAIGLADLGGYAAFKATALGNRGEARLRLGQFELALDDLETAKAVFQRLGSMMVCYPLGLLGELHHARGQLALARAAFSEAAEVGRRSGDMQGLVPAAAGLARLLAEDDPAAARRLAEEAVARGPVLGQVEALLALGWVTLGQGRVDREAGDGPGDAAGNRPGAAAEGPTAAADIAARVVELAGARRDRAGLAEAFELRAASTDNAAQARRHLHDALALWEELLSPFGQGRVLTALARLGGPEAAARARRAERLLRPLGARRLAGEAARLASAARTPRPLAIQCLGGFAVVRDGAPVAVAEWKSRKARDLVKILIARHGRPVHRGVILDLLWPTEPPERSSSRLSVTLSTARAVLDPGKAQPAGWFLVADADTLALDVDHVEVDVLVFLELAAGAIAHRKDGPFPAALDALAYAEGSYVGDAFPEDPYEDWAVSLRERARAAYISVARTLADDAAAGGDPGTAVRCYLRVLEHDGFDEQAHLGLVRTQLAAGQQGEARRSYRAYSARMDELGAEAAPFPRPTS